MNDNEYVSMSVHESTYLCVIDVNFNLILCGQQAARAARSWQFQNLLGAVLCLRVAAVLTYLAGVSYRTTGILRDESLSSATPGDVAFCWLLVV